MTMSSGSGWAAPIGPEPEEEEVLEVEEDNFQLLTPNNIAQKFHEAYERLAPTYSYKTREASAVPWDEVPTNNKNLMMAVVRSLIEEGVISPGEVSTPRSSYGEPIVEVDDDFYIFQGKLHCRLEHKDQSDAIVGEVTPDSTDEMIAQACVDHDAAHHDGPNDGPREAE